MKKYMALGLVGLLGCNGSDDSGRLEGSGSLFESGQDEEKYFIQSHGERAIHFPDGLGDKSYGDVVRGDSSNYSYPSEDAMIFHSGDNSVEILKEIAGYIWAGSENTHQDVVYLHGASSDLRLTEENFAYSSAANKDCGEYGLFTDFANNLVDNGDAVLVTPGSPDNSVEESSQSIDTADPSAGNKTTGLVYMFLVMDNDPGDAYPAAIVSENCNW
jgi:hypothetical protein